MSTGTKMERVNIRNVDRDLIKKARIDALKRGITLGAWVNEAIREKLALRLKTLPLDSQKPDLHVVAIG